MKNKMKIDLWDFSELGNLGIETPKLTADNIMDMSILGSGEPVGYPDSFTNAEQEKTNERD